MLSTPLLTSRSLYGRVSNLLTRGGVKLVLLHTDNPLSCVLELVLYLSVAYLLAAKVIRAVLRSLSVKQHARDSCAEALLLGASSTVCLLLCWTELRPRRDVHRRANSLVGVFMHSRLFDEYNTDLTNSRAVFVSVSALLLHSAGVAWYNRGLELQVVKKTAFFAAYVTARNLRFKCLGPAATALVALTELVLQLTRVVCCVERARYVQTPVLTYLSLATYVVVWTAVFVGVWPWFFLRPCLCRETPVSRMPPMCLLCGSLFVFYVIELVTMPLLKVLKQWIAPSQTSRVLRGGRLDRVLIPPPVRVLRELDELHTSKMRARAAQEEFDRRHGSNKKTRDVYKSLKMIMAVKRRIRNFRQAKLRKESEESSTTTLASEPPGDLHLSSASVEVTASTTPNDLHWSPPSVEVTAKQTPSDLHLCASSVEVTAKETVNELHMCPSSVDITAKETHSDLYLCPASVDITAQETTRDSH